MLRELSGATGRIVGRDTMGPATRVLLLPGCSHKLLVSGVMTSISGSLVHRSVPGEY
jgi:hypothetical protein